MAARPAADSARGVLANAMSSARARSGRPSASSLYSPSNNRKMPNRATMLATRLLQPSTRLGVRRTAATDRDGTRGRAVRRRRRGTVRRRRGCTGRRRSDPRARTARQARPGLWRTARRRLPASSGTRPRVAPADLAESPGRRPGPPSATSPGPLPSQSEGHHPGIEHDRRRPIGLASDVEMHAAATHVHHRARRRIAQEISDVPAPSPR